MSRILSPNPLQIVITVNEVTGAITAIPSKPMPHIAIAGIYSQLITATLAEAMQQAAGQRLAHGITPPDNPSENPATNPGGGSNGPTKTTN